MTVSTTTNKALHTGNGSATQFAYTFRMDNDDDMEVYLNEVLQPSGYTVSREPDNVGGNVIFSVAPPAGVRITLLRVLDLTQEADYVAGDPFPAESHEQALDKLTLIAQDLQEEVSRTVKAPIGDDPSIDYDMPPYAQGAAIVWSDSDPKTLENSNFPLDQYKIDCANSAAAASNSETNALASEINAATSEANSATSESNAATSASAASTSETNAATSETNAETARDFAKDWANKAENVLVNDGVNPTDYSAYHYAQKAKLLNVETLAAIDKIVNSNSVTDVLIYDTSDDDDGGAWVDKASTQSWYHEQLNTIDRGATRQFPKVAALVLEVSKLTIYDLTDPTCPMWMSFSVGGVWGGSWPTSTFNMILDQHTAKSVTAKNGMLYVGKHSDGLFSIDFIKDTAGVHTSVFGNFDLWLGNGIADRNNGSSFRDENLDGALVNQAINNVAVTSDGNMNNLVYVTTNDGVSRITHEGEVSSWTLTATPYIATNVSIFGEYVTWCTNTNVTQLTNIILPTSTELTVDLANSFMPRIVGGAFQAWGANIIPYSFGDVYTSTQDLSGDYIGTDKGLLKYTKDGVDDNTIGYDMINLITDSWLSGWMQGDIKGAWLADSIVGSLVGTELVTNGTFDTDISGWTDLSSVGGSIAWNATGALDLIFTTATAKAGQAITTVAGQTYDLDVDKVSGTIWIRVGTTEGGSELFAGDQSANPEVVTFTATTTTTYISFTNSNTGTTDTIDNVSVRLADPDRSVNNKGLAVHGTITKSAVASGAELVAYGGFQYLTDYLKQAYNPDLDVGTGVVAIALWIKNTDSGLTGVVVSRGKASETRITLRLDSSDVLNFETTGDTQLTSSLPLSDSWTHVVAIRGLNSKTLYINGKLDASTNNTPSDLTNTTAELAIGAYPDGSVALEALLALVRISKTAPTAEQIRQIYESEKPLFQENTKCTLQGSSSDVKALDYDESKDVLTVCSADHITKFNGLVVVEDRAEVATSVSTACGMEITGD